MAKTAAATLVAWAALGLVTGCADDFEPAAQVLFRGQHAPLAGYVNDTGFQPPGAGVQVRVKTTATGLIKAEALGQAAQADGPIVGVRGTGKLALDAKLVLQALLKINTPGAKFEGALKSPTTISLTFAGVDTFDPFLLGTHKTLTVVVPRTAVATIPLTGQVPGATGSLVLHLGGKLVVQLHGVCARAAAGIAGYSARTVTSGDLTLTAGGQISIQGLPSVLSTTTIPVVIPATSALMDLGSRPVINGVVPGKGPCAVAVDAGPGDGSLADSSPDGVADLLPPPDSGTCSAGGLGTGSLCKKASDCQCPGTCLRVFKDLPGSCWTFCDPTKTNTTTGQNPACKNSGYGEACHGGCLPLGPITGSFDLPVYSHPNSPSTVSELGTADVKMGSETFKSGWGSTLDATSSFSHTLVLYGSTGSSVDLDKILQILFPRTSVYKANQSYNLSEGKQIEVRYVEITSSGAVITRKRLRGFSWDGTLNLMAAGSGKKDPAKGGLTGRLASYETELCGSYTTPCK